MPLCAVHLLTHYLTTFSFRKHVEHRDLAVGLVLLALGGGVDDVGRVVLVDEAHELLAWITRRVEGTRLDEGLDHAAVCLAAVDTLAEVMEALEGA